MPLPSLRLPASRPFAFVVGLLAALPALAQTAPSPAPLADPNDRQVIGSDQIAAAPAGRDNRPVMLNPFEVNTSRDRGFAAADSLAGGRLALDLKDTPVAYSVITQEFIQALGITDLNEAASWTPNYTPVVNAAGGGFSDDIYGLPQSYSIRGAGLSGTGQGPQSRNFFIYTAPMDSYAVERYDFGRGPNSVLFGNGTLGGLSSTMTKRATLNRTFGSISETAGSWSQTRTAIDLNASRGDTFAVRGDAVYADTGDWRDRGFNKSRGAFLTSTFQPTKDATIRLEGEYGNSSRAVPFTNLADDFSGWDGHTTFNGVALTLPSNPNAVGIGRVGTQNPVYNPAASNEIMSYLNMPTTLSGDANNQVPIGGFVQGALPSFGVSGATLLHAQDVPSNRFGTALANSAFRIPGDAFTVTKDSPTIGQRYSDVQLTIDDHLGDFFLEAAMDLNHTKQETHNSEARGSLATYIDIDTQLPNGAPNPEFLRPYDDSTMQKGIYTNDAESFHLAAAYVKDLGRWGNYSFNVLAGVTALYNAQYTYNLSVAQSADHRVWDGHGAGFDPNPQLLGDPARPFGVPDTAEYQNPTLGIDSTIHPFWSLIVSTPNAVHQVKTTYDFGLASLTAKYFDDRIVILGAIRTDDFNSLIRQTQLQGNYSPTGWDGLSRMMRPNAPSNWATLSYVPLNSAGVPTGVSQPALTRPRDATGTPLPQYATNLFQDDFNSPAVKQTVTTPTIGTVVHFTKWLSGQFNFAETFNPPLAIERLNGTFIPPTVAKGVDYGLRGTFLDGRVNVSAAAYRNYEVNNAFDPGVEGNLNTIINATAMGDPVAGDINRRGLQPIAGGRDLRDRLAKGYEFETVVNLSRNWRLMGNVGLPKVYEDNSYQDTRRYLAANLGTLQQIVVDTGGVISSANVASINAAIPVANLSPNANAAVTAYNNLTSQINNIVTGKRLDQNQPNFNIYTDYTFRTTLLKGLRLGGGLQYRGEAIIGNRGSDTIVNPANPATAIKDPASTAYTPVYSGTVNHQVVGTIGYTLPLKDRRQIAFNLRINNLLNQRGAIYGSTAVRPLNGDYTSPARVTVPYLYALLPPINYQLTTTINF